MNQTIAGLLGAFIGASAAIGGGFGVQILNGRQTTNRRRQELIATFLTTLEAIRIRSFVGSPDDSDDIIREHKREILALHEQAATVGHELALMCGSEMSLEVRTAIQAAILIWWTADLRNVESGEKFRVTDDFESTIESLTDLLYAKYGV